MVSELQFYMARTIKCMDEALCGIDMPRRDSLFMRCLVTYGKKYLKTYDEETWGRDEIDSEMLSYFETVDDLREENVVKCIMFILASMKLNVMHRYDVDLIAYIASILSTREILAPNFEKYVDVFFEKRIYEELSWLDEERKLLCIVDIVDGITLANEGDDLVTIAWETLARIQGLPPSPLLGGSYDLSSVYETLKSIMYDSAYLPFFEANDFRRLSCIKSLLESRQVGDLDGVLIAENLSNIEIQCRLDKVRCVKRMLGYLHSYWAFTVKGIGVLNDKNKSFLSK